MQSYDKFEGSLKYWHILCNIRPPEFNVSQGVFFFLVFIFIPVSPHTALY